MVEMLALFQKEKKDVLKKETNKSPECMIMWLITLILLIQIK
jgi:hypothetical protein